MGVAALQGEAAFEAACILPEGGAALQVLRGHQQFEQPRCSNFFNS